MNLTYREKEAFYRGKAAGIIPADCPMPQTGEEIDALIVHIGPMCSRTVGCRNQAGKLFFVEVSVFSQKYLEETIEHLPDLIPEVSEVTELRYEKYNSPLEDLANYFALGPAIINEADIAAWFSHCRLDNGLVRPRAIRSLSTMRCSSVAQSAIFSGSYLNSKPFRMSSAVKWENHAAISASLMIAGPSAK